MDMFLDNSEFKEPTFTSSYTRDGKVYTEQKTHIYEDDSIKEVFIKLAIASKKDISNDGIFAWIKQGSKIIPLAFNYPGLSMDIPFKHNKIDPAFIDREGNRIALQIETTIYKIMEYFNQTTIFYTTIVDYLRYLGLGLKNKITDEECKDKTSYECSELFNGKIRKYWPGIKNINEVFNYNHPPLVKHRSTKIKSERSINERNKIQTDIIYKTKKPLFASEFKTYVCSVTNSQGDNNVHLFRLFSDISLGIINKVLIPFSKITLENYDDSYCKLLKDVISYTGVDTTRFVTKGLFLKWYNSQVITIPGTPVRFMDDRNSLTFKLYKEDKYVTVIIYSDGQVKVLFTDLIKDVFIRPHIEGMIQLVNKFLEYLNEKKIYFESPIKLIEKKYALSFDFMTSYLVYPVTNYQMKHFITLLKNLSAFVRFNKTQETMISCIYKRVSDYDNIDSKLRVISLLHNSKRKLKKDDIIKELETIFNISEEEATEEYEQWYQLSNGGKVFQKGESGIEFIIDLLGTNVKVDISSVSSYEEFTRIYKFLNGIMRIYQNFIETNKDPLGLFKPNAKLNKEYESMEESIAKESIAKESIATPAPPKPKQVIAKKPEQVIAKKPEQVIAKKPEQVIAKNVSKDESDVDSSTSDSDSSLSIPRLDDSDASTGGGKQTGGKQTGGYNVNRYYSDRLNRYDKDLFSGYSAGQQKSTKNKGYQAYTYARKCFAGRQPIAVTKDELDKINATDEGEGVSFYEAVSIDGRDPNIYYMCPKYWDVKEDRPRNPLRVDEFKDHIVDNKMKAQQKKITDKYILRRDEYGYWDNAGDEISRYKIELWDNFHPDDFEVPCCRAPREGADSYEKGWKVDVLVNVGGKLEWKQGIVKSSTKKEVDVTRGGRTDTFNKKNVRRRRDSMYITNSFPCNLGTYGHINPVIKQLVHQDVKNPEPRSSNNMGLIRKGIKRGKRQTATMIPVAGGRDASAGGRDASAGDQSLLDSLQEILPHNNSSVVKLIEHILHDLENYPNQEGNPSLFSIGGGSFVNKFKMDITDLNDKYSLYFIRLIKKKYPFVQRFFKPYKGKKMVGKDILFRIITKAPLRSRSIINQELKSYTSLIQFRRYLTDKNEIVLDQYIIPVLHAISQYPSKTFGSVPLIDLSIVVFEGNNEDVIISPPMGGFPRKSESMILLYKERGHQYEPILYRRFEHHRGILRYYTDIFRDQNDTIESIMNNIQDKLDEFNNDTPATDQVMSVVELTNIMNQLNLPIHTYIYDNYNKIIHIVTDKNVLIPVSPSDMKNYSPRLYYPELMETHYPTYADAIEILKMIDSKSIGKGYLVNAGLSVIGLWVKGSFTTKIKEIILESGHYIPVQKEDHNEKVHKLDIVTNHSYREIDMYIGSHSISNDARYDYTMMNNYKKVITELFFQKVYLMIKGNESLYSKIRKIKDHPIKLRPHKSNEIYQLLELKVLRELIILEEEDFDISLDDEIKNKLVIRNVDELKNHDFYHKLLKSFIELLIIYDYRDYERFLQLDMNLTKLRQLIKNNELLFTFTDIRNETYLQKFIRYSQYIRNVSLYGEGLSRSKIIQLNKLKDKSRNRSKLDRSIVKQYPQIIHTLFGRGLILTRYENEAYSELRTISDILVDVVDSEEEMNSEKIQALLQCKEDHKLRGDDLDILSDTYGIGFCLVTHLVTKRLEHDIIIKLHKHALLPSTDDIPMLLLYQYESTLIHIQKGGETTRLGELTSPLFKKHLKQQHGI